jgi:hypothetical protein
MSIMQWYTWKEKLLFLDDWEASGLSLKACSRNHKISPKNLQRWRHQTPSFLVTAELMCDVKTRHYFLNKQTLNPGAVPRTVGLSLDKILKMYRELMKQYRIVTLNMLAVELNCLSICTQGLTMAAMRCHIYRLINMHGVVRSRVTHVTQNMQYEQVVIQGWIT